MMRGHRDVKMPPPDPLLTPAANPLAIAVVRSRDLEPGERFVRPGDDDWALGDVVAGIKSRLSLDPVGITRYSFPSDRRSACQSPYHSSTRVRSPLATATTRINSPRS